MVKKFHVADNIDSNIVEDIYRTTKGYNRDNFVEQFLKNSLDLLLCWVSIMPRERFRDGIEVILSVEPYPNTWLQKTPWIVTVRPKDVPLMVMKGLYQPEAQILYADSERLDFEGHGEGHRHYFRIFFNPLP